MQKHRIYTNIGRDQKINVEIKQDFDLLEVLSLKFTQKDIYASGICSEYGVVVGRISANNGFGIPNAKVSIFIPLDEIDENDPVISALYPYKDISDKDENGYRYNLLPERQQHPGHTPTGTFMDQQDILTREECLEVFEKYYKYTVKTNSAGDFMIWGVPIGAQTLHIDIDLSDMGCFSLRPFDFIKKGNPISDFENYYSFKSSSDIDTLPQIISFDKVIDVYPFWGNEELCEIAVTRSDFDLSERNIKVEPTAIILFSSVTDENSHAVKRTGKIRKESGYKCNLQTLGGDVECVRYTGQYVLGSDGVTEYPELEYFTISDSIDENGVSMIQLPMNLEYVYTNEFGEEEITNDPNKGIPTSAVARFKFSLDFQGKKIATANYLVPNIREFNPNSNGTADGIGYGTLRYGLQYSEGMLASYTFSDNFEDYITVTPPSGVTISSYGYSDSVKAHKRDLMLGVNNNGIPEDYFYKFNYNKVYTVSSFQGTHYESSKRDAFLGIKEIRPNTESDCASSTNYFPTNFAFKNRTKFNVVISQVVLFAEFIWAVIAVKFAEVIGKVAFTIGNALIGVPVAKRIFWRVAQRLMDFGYRTQDRYTRELPLMIYPDCEECTTDDESAAADTADFSDEYCRTAEVRLHHIVDTGATRVNLYILWTEGYVNNWTLPGSSYLGEEGGQFPGDAAKETEGLCSGTTLTTISYADLNDLQYSGLTNDESGIDVRWAGIIYPLAPTGYTNFSPFNIYFKEKITSEDIEYVHFTTISPPATAMQLMQFTYEEWFDLSGQDFLNNIELRNIFASSGGATAILRIYDRSLKQEELITSVETFDIEEGCQKYDKLYDERYMRAYLWCTGSTLDYDATKPENLPPKYPSQCYPPYFNDPAYCEQRTMPTNHPYLISTIVGSSTTQRLPYRVAWPKIGNTTSIGVKYYDRKTKSGLTEIRDGVFTIIPVIQGRSYNIKVIQEWYRRKRVGLSFCGGVVNYSFIDNWLNGVLYFFKFNKRIKWDNENQWDINQRRSKFPLELIFYHIFDKTFYYRSCPYHQYAFSGQTIPDSSNKEILHPTTFYDLGVRDDFLNEICTDSRIDPTCSVVREIGVTSYQDPANIVEYAINYRMDISRSKFDLNDFFSIQRDNSRIKIFDGDITQLMSMNCEAGIEGFDMDTSYYFMYNGEYMDPETVEFGSFFNSGVSYGPTPIDLKLDDDGAYVRLCLNNRLGDYTQRVPFYLWEKEAPGFGKYGSGSDDQEWDRSAIASLPLQRIFSVSGITDTLIQVPEFPYVGRTNYLMADGEEEFILKPMTITHDTFSMTGSTEDMLERFEMISYSPPPNLNDTTGYIEGDLWLYVPPTSGTTKDPQGGWIYIVVNKTWVLQSDPYIDNYREMFIPQTALNYYGVTNDAKQVLSTPFLFYFGLRPGKTALDLLLKYFGGIDAFPPEETVTCSVNDIVVPSGTPTPTPTLPPPPSDTSEIYFNPVLDGQEAIMAVNNPNGRLFTITILYTIDAAVDNIWSYGGDPVQTTTTLYVSLNGGSTWIDIDSITAEVPGGIVDPNGQYDYNSIIDGTYTLINVTDVSNVRVYADYTCDSSTNYRSGSAVVSIAGVSVNTGSAIIICNNTFTEGCGTTPSVYCIDVPTVTPTVTVTPTPAPVLFGFSPYNGTWEYNEQGTSYAVISTILAQNIETFALASVPSWITVQAWDVGHWVTMSVDTYYDTDRIDTIRFYPNSTNGHTQRGGALTFKNQAGNIINYYDETFSSQITVVQYGMPYGVSYTWDDNLGTCCSCAIQYYVEDDLSPYTNPEHGMSVGSSSYSLSFWTDCTDQYVTWSIYRNNPNPMVLASGTGVSTGIRVRPGHISVKSGTLAEPISDGDNIIITIGSMQMLPD